MNTTIDQLQIEMAAGFRQINYAIDALRQHLALSIEAMRSDMALRDEAQRAHVNLRLEYLRSEINRHIYEQGRMARDRTESLQQELIRLASQP